MSEAPSPSSGQRFANDLHRIREDRKVSLEEVHEETKIPIGLLEQFEASGLFDHPMFNRVYLRSLVRTYARKVGLPIDGALAMLDQALEGEYAGELAAEYFDEPVEGGPEPSDTDAETPSPPDNEDAVEDAPVTSAEDDAVPDESAEVDEAATVSGEPPAAARKTPPMARTVDEPSPSAGEPEPPPAPVSTPHSGIQRQWIIGGAVIALLCAVIVAIVLMTGGETSQDPTGPAPSEDTVATSAPETAPLDAPTLPSPEVEVGDTLDVLVVAADGRIQGIRITRDEDVRRPYWIEQGEALAVPVRQRIVIEQGIDDIDLYVEGFAYPIEQETEDLPNRLVITRDDVQSFVERQSNSPSAPDVPTDTVAMPPRESP